MTAALIAASLQGGPCQVMADAAGNGLVGIDVASRTIDGHPWTVVQLLLDDDHPLFDPSLLDSPVVAEVRTHGHGEGSATVLALEPFDHDAFRHQLLREQESGESTTRGVLVRTGGHLPPRYIRLAFLPVELAATAGCELEVRRTSVAELVAGAESAYSRGDITDDERRSLLISIEQRHPTPSA